MKAILFLEEVVNFKTSKASKTADRKKTLKERGTKGMNIS